VGGIGERVDHRLIDRQPIRHVLGAVEKLTVRCQWNKLSADGFKFGGLHDVPFNLSNVDWSSARLGDDAVFRHWETFRSRPSIWPLKLGRLSAKGDL
jgi:hypothetical protein